ncbi:hypothetical protein EHYA_07598 [Embleya hyalina]|uniref:Uncharacterized protein n=1 Tax=Embleya hyalina TaxID=516124 RepID=A0A401YZ25_9ACTN|nr:hypothetical protein EHYA_07598 [Embleya hyalina]
MPLSKASSDAYGATAHPVDWETGEVHHYETGELIGYLRGDEFVALRPLAELVCP